MRAPKINPRGNVPHPQLDVPAFCDKGQTGIPPATDSIDSTLASRHDEQDRIRFVAGQDDRPTGTLPHGPWTAATKPPSRVEETLIEVEADRAYPIRTTWLGKSYEFDVRFGEALVQLFRKRGVKFNLATCEAVGTNRTRLIEIPAEIREAHCAAYGCEPPAWLMFVFDLRLFGFPKGTLTLDFVDGDLTFATPDGIDYGVRALHDMRFAEHNARRAPTVEESALPAKIHAEALDLTVCAQTPELAQRATDAFEKVCRVAAERWPQRKQRLLAEQAALEKLTEEWNHFVESLEQETGSPADGVALLAKIHALVAPGDERAASPVDCVRALESRRALVARALAPVTVVVVPEGVDFTLLPQAHTMKEEERAAVRGGIGINMVSPRERVVFIPAEDLAGKQRTTLHELYHTLEDRYLGDSERRQIDAIHARTLAAGGPFASIYGVQRSEFFTTSAEEFEGVHGGEGGPAWLERELPELYELLCRITGRRPA